MPDRFLSGSSRHTPLSLVTVVLLAFWATPLGAAQKAAETACSSCHEQGKKLAASAHASLPCEGCHENHEKYPHPKKVEKPVCGSCHPEVAGQFALGVHGQTAAKGKSGAPDCGVCHGSAHELLRPSASEFHKAVPETCGMCHSEISEQYKASVHGKALAEGKTGAPLCTACHGEHTILAPSSAASPVNPNNIRETCGRCHNDVRLGRRLGLPLDRVVSFDASFHGLAAKSGSQTVANCASCHGIHNILPSSDPKSTVHQKNLAATCGKCHPGAGKRFAIGQVHQWGGKAEAAYVTWVREFYVILIPLVIGLMALHNMGDFARKAWFDRLGRAWRNRDISTPVVQKPGMAHRKREVRMYPLERLQHLLLVVSFLVLVWTGFALKYPDQFWARPLVAWESSWPVRGTLHRIAAVIMMAGSVLHLVTIIASRKLRQHWLTMLPVRRDVPEAILGFAYNLGLITRKPKISAHSYIEKAEYWAVVWGTLVMAASGILLWANNWALSYLPKSILDLSTTVHFYEAVLATLAIFVWHFYTVIFDPDVYPLDTAWLSGYSVREHGHEPEEPEKVTVTKT